MQIAVDDRLRPGADWADLAAAMADHGPADRVALVGHDPDLSDALAEPERGGVHRPAQGRHGLPGVRWASRMPGTGRLRWLLDPDLYRDDPQHG